jgi:drug/metabolite transporter (DMT)-like permease
MFRTTIQTSSLILTLAASVFLFRSNLGLTPEIIAKLSSTCWGYSPSLIKTFAQQSANTSTGAFLLFLAFILQLINSLWPKRFCDFAVSWKGVVLSIILCTTIMIIAYSYSNIKTDQLVQNTTVILKTEK